MPWDRSKLRTWKVGELVFAGDMLNKGGWMKERRQRVKISAPRYTNDRNPLTDAIVRYDAIADTDYAVVEGYLEIEIEELDRFVEVQFIDPHPTRGTISPAYELFTYQVPDGMTLKVGDIVDVPTMYKLRNRAVVRKVDSNNLPNAVNYRFVKGVLMRAR